jgi:hypothetical protein
MILNKLFIVGGSEYFFKSGIQQSSIYFRIDHMFLD